jgi:hypothetical protein
MSQKIRIDGEEIFKQVKLSFQIPRIFEDIVVRKIIETKAEELGINVEATELQKWQTIFE